MDEMNLKRIDAKLDIVIGLLQDGILTAEEVALLKETDKIIQRNYSTELVKL